jgi:NRAMP (natural resistance-associated macrophage protein)-like metal ion transporter
VIENFNLEFLFLYPPQLLDGKGYIKMMIHKKYSRESNSNGYESAIEASATPSPSHHHQLQQQQEDESFSDAIPPSPRLEVLEAFADRMFSSRSELVEVPHTADDNLARKFSFRTLLSYVGPGLLTSVAFVDPGNIESDLQAGSYSGYRLLWVVALSTAIGLMFQSLAARLGTVTGKDLASNCAQRFGYKDVRVLWCMAQVAIIGSDIQEIVGSAVAFRLLFGFPLWIGCLLTGLDTLTFLGLHATGIRRLEAVFAMLILIMVVCFFANFFITSPDISKMVEGIFVPKVTEQNSIQAASILGAVIMPHNIFLHSALVLSRDVDRTKVNEVREANFYFTLEAGLALFVAFLINTAIVSVFAHGFYSSTCEQIFNPLSLYSQPNSEKVDPPFACVPVDRNTAGTNQQCTSGLNVPGTCQPIGLQVAGKPLESLLGQSASLLWAIGLLAAGQSSTVTGTYAGQFVMEGMLNLRLANWKRVAFTRMVALVPATFVAVLASHDYLAADRLNERLNVVQSVQLPFALVPLLTLCGDSTVMGSEFRLSSFEKIVGWAIGTAIICVNIFLLVDRLETESKGMIALAGGFAVFYIWFLHRFTPKFWKGLPDTNQSAGTGSAEERRQLLSGIDGENNPMYL